MRRTLVLALALGWLLGGGSQSRASSTLERSEKEPVPELLRGCNPGTRPPDLGVPIPKPQPKGKPAPADPTPGEAAA